LAIDNKGKEYLSDNDDKTVSGGDYEEFETNAATGAGLPNVLQYLKSNSQYSLLYLKPSWWIF